ncbi:MAG: LptF/LptG family permease [Elusimicrobia bacterium]|nr:LptF/LptG family permease [Elusimicrobiota bacterium]
MHLFLWAFFREFLGNFGLGIGIFSLFFFFGESSRLLDLALLVSGENFQVFLGSLGNLYLKYWLTVAGFVLPMAMMLGIALTIGRLQEDRELLALESLGINAARQLTMVAVVLGGIGYYGLGHLVHEVSPRSRLDIKRFAYEGRDLSRNFKIEPRTWVDLQSAQIFAEETVGNTLKNVVIYSRRNGNDAPPDGAVEEFPYKVTGSSATYFIVENDESGAALEAPLLFLKVAQGKLEYPDASKIGHVTTCRFDSYENYVPLKPTAALEPGIRETGSRQLKLNSPEDISGRTEIGAREAVALSPLSLAFVCAVVCFRMSRRSKGFGFGLALTLLAFYWIFMVACVTIGVPWLSNPAFAIFGIIVSRFFW